MDDQPKTILLVVFEVHPESIVGILWWKESHLDLCELDPSTALGSKTQGLRRLNSFRFSPVGQLKLN